MLEIPRGIPARPSVWLFGEGAGAQVWTVEGDTRVWASVLVTDSSPVILLNRLIAGTPLEHGVLDWALSRIAYGGLGFYVLCNA